MYALNSKRLEQLRHALRCLDAAKLRLPVTIQCFPGCQRPAAREMLDSLRRGFRFNVTVWTDDDLDDKTFRRSTLHKAVAAYHSPYRRTLVMDTDACVRSSRLTQMFGPLADFDFVSVWECCAKGAMSAYKTGWEPQTGVFALRRSARALVQWFRTFYKAETHYERFTSSDQQALLDTLRKKQTYSFFPYASHVQLPPLHHAVCDRRGASFARRRGGLTPQPLSVKGEAGKQLEPQRVCETNRSPVRLRNNY